MKNELSIIRCAGGIDEAIATLLANQPDLFVEGATGSRPLLKKLITKTTSIPYVGVDINTEVLEDGAFTQYGNCAMPEDMEPIIAQYQSKRTALVTWMALTAILSDRISHDEGKDHRDILGERLTMQNINSLYTLQMHVLPSSLFEEAKDFYALCQSNGWKLNSYENNSIMLLTR